MYRRSIILLSLLVSTAQGFGIPSSAATIGGNDIISSRSPTFLNNSPRGALDIDSSYLSKTDDNIKHEKKATNSKFVSMAELGAINLKLPVGMAPTKNSAEQQKSHNMMMMVSDRQAMTPCCAEYPLCGCSKM